MSSSSASAGLRQLDDQWALLTKEFLPFRSGDEPPAGVTDEEIDAAYEEVQALYTETRYLFLDILAAHQSSSAALPNSNYTSILEQTQVVPAKLSLPKLPVPKFTGHFAQ